MILTPFQLDALREMINIGVGRAAGILNAMLRSHIVLRLPEVALLSHAEVEARASQYGPEVFAAVRLGFRGPFAGSAALVFPTDSAARLVVMLTEGEAGLSGDPDLDSIRIGTLTEVGNIVLNSVMGAIGNEIKQRIFYSVPAFHEESLRKMLADSAPGEGSHVIWVQTQFSVEDRLIDGDIVLVFELGSLDLLLDAVNRQLQPEA
jgi:chemotaxis protein CheC